MNIIHESLFFYLNSYIILTQMMKTNSFDILVCSTVAPVIGSTMSTTTTTTSTTSTTSTTTTTTTTTTTSELLILRSNSARSFFLLLSNNSIDHQYDTTVLLWTSFVICTVASVRKHRNIYGCRYKYLYIQFYSIIFYECHWFQFPLGSHKL